MLEYNIPNKAFSHERVINNEVETHVFCLPLFNLVKGIEINKVGGKWEVGSGKASLYGKKEAQGFGVGFG